MQKFCCFLAYRSTRNTVIWEFLKKFQLGEKNEGPSTPTIPRDESIKKNRVEIRSGSREISWCKKLCSGRLHYTTPPF